MLACVRDSINRELGGTTITFYKKKGENKTYSRKDQGFAEKVISLFPTTQQSFLFSSTASSSLIKSALMI